MSLDDQQLAERYTGIGGSEAPAALGLSPWKTPLELFLDKREQRVTTANEAMRWGQLLEPVIRQEYAERTGRIVRMPPGTIRHGKFKFMLAHFDGVTDDQRIFEAKTARSSEGWGPSGSDEIPHHYLIQVQHYLAVTGFAIADVAALIGGNDFRIYEVPADAELQELIIDGEATFWAAFLRGEPPEPDYESDRALDIVRRLYPGTDGSTIQADFDDTSIRVAYEECLNQQSNSERLAKSMKAQLLAKMGNAARMVFDDGVQLRRQLVQRKEHTVKATEYMDARFTNKTTKERAA